MKTILVTGGAGFIGSNFVRQVLCQRTARVVNLDKLTYAGNLESLAEFQSHPQYVFAEGEIGDSHMVAALLRNYAVDAVVNFAAESHVDRSIDGPRDFVMTNVVGTFELLNACREYWKELDSNRRKAFRFLHVSTDEVYGSLGAEGKFMETTPYAPNSPYSASKASSDHFVRAFHHTFGLPVLTTNCSNNYGPRQFPEKLIPLVILNALEGRALPVYGDGGNVRDWLFVDDHCQAIQAVLQRGRVGEVYNIGGDAEQTNLAVVQTICRTIDRLCPELAHRPCETLITFVADRPGHDRRYAIDAGKIKRELGWAPTVRFEEGIERTVAWYLENKSWTERIASGQYKRERLGLSTPSESSINASANGTCTVLLHDQQTSNNGTTALVQRETSACVVGESESIAGVEFRSLERFDDSRGWLMEIFRADEIPPANVPVMCYISQSNPGVLRGPHEHVEQADFFGFLGPGDFKLYLWDARQTSPTFGRHLTMVVGQSNPQSVIIPPGVVHAYSNISDVPGWVINAPNRLYAGWGRREAVDEIRHEDKIDSPYHVT